MLNELSSYLNALDRRSFDVDAGSVTCWFGNKDHGRRHTVRVQEVADGLLLEATVATRGVVDAMESDPARWAWRRNRATSLVGFRIDNKRRLIAEAVLPPGLSPEEFAICLHAVAAEADRMELVLTGKDLQ